MSNADFDGPPSFCGIFVGFPTLCQLLRYLFIYLFICVREQSVRHVVLSSTRKREDPGNEVECFRGGHHSWLLFICRISTCLRGAINPQGKENSL